MKLREGFIIQDIEDTQFLVPVGARAFPGIARSNRTAAFIVNRLREDTSEEQIIDALYERYDAPREEIAADVREILASLRRINALEEN